MNSRYMYDYFDEWGDGEYLSGNAFFDKERFMRSETGKNLMEARSLMTRFTDVDDPALLSFWEKTGVKCQVRETKGVKWLAFIPAEAFESTQRKYPVLLCFRPVGLLGEAFYYYDIQLAAQGECITLIYSSEDPEENELFEDFINEIAEEFPVDRSRVYATGHSHYGELAGEYTRRHHNEIAALAQEGDSAGMILDFYGMTREKIELMHTYDMPEIMIAGTTEMTGIYPMNREAPGVTDEHLRRRFQMSVEDRITGWQRRLYAQRLPEKTAEEILAAGSKCRAEAEIGVPLDRAYTVYAEGMNCYVGDIDSVDGKKHFRIAALENVPHTTCRVMQLLSWSFLRRFARNGDGSVQELYEE